MPLFDFHTLPLHVRVRFSLSCITLNSNLLFGPIPLKTSSFFYVWKKKCFIAILESCLCTQIKVTTPSLFTWNPQLIFFSSFMLRFESGWMPHCLQTIHYSQFTLTISYERKGMGRWKFLNLQINIMMTNFSSTLSTRMYIHCKVFKSL